MKLYQTYPYSLPSAGWSMESNKLGGRRKMNQIVIIQSTYTAKLANYYMDRTGY